LGRRIQPGGIGDNWYTIVGVVADVKNSGIDKPTGTAFYLPHTQVPLFQNFLRSPYIAIRSAGAPSSIVSAVRRELREMDPALPLAKVRTMNEVMSATQSRPRFLAVLMTLFAGVALVLAAVGIYGVISYSVAQRTKEFGIRLALGAQHGTVVNLVLKRGVLLTLCGVALGLAGAFALTRFLSGLLFGLTATDPVTFIGVSLILGGIALIASYIPARRATKVDPLVALRTE
jgi:putative ABC transport system permease protein